MRVAIVLCGGFGMRLRDSVSDRPKSMALIHEKPFLEYQFHYLREQGVGRIILATGYMSLMIETFFGSEYLGMEIFYSVEKEPLGTGGAIAQALELVSEEQVIILNGDTLFQIPISKLEEFKESTSSHMVIAMREVEDASRYGEVKVDDRGMITGFMEKSSNVESGVVNGGIYFVDTEELKKVIAPLPKKFSFEKEILEKQFKPLKIAGVSFSNYFLDIGIPQDYERAQNEFPRFED